MPLRRKPQTFLWYPGMLWLWGWLCLATYPLNASTYTEGYSRYIEGSFEAAEKLFQEAASQEKTPALKAKAMKMLGICEYMLQKKQKAEAHFAQAKGLDPSLTVTAQEVLDISIIPVFQQAKPQGAISQPKLKDQISPPAPSPAPTQPPQSSIAPGNPPPLSWGVADLLPLGIPQFRRDQPWLGVLFGAAQLGAWGYSYTNWVQSQKTFNEINTYVTDRSEIEANISDEKEQETFHSETEDTHDRMYKTWQTQATRASVASGVGFLMWGISAILAFRTSAQEAPLREIQKRSEVPSAPLFRMNAGVSPSGEWLLKGTLSF